MGDSDLTYSKVLAGTAWDPGLVAPPSYDLPAQSVPEKEPFWADNAHPAVRIEKAMAAAMTAILSAIPDDIEEEVLLLLLDRLTSIVEALANDQTDSLLAKKENE